MAIEIDDVEDLKDRAYDMFCEGRTLSDIAKEVGRDVSRVSRWKSAGNWDGRRDGMEDGPGPLLIRPEDVADLTPQELQVHVKGIIVGLVNEASKSLATTKVGFKNVYHYKALVEILKILQEAARLSAEMPSDIKEVRHVHIIDAPLATQIKWLESMVTDGVRDVVIEGELADD